MEQAWPFSARFGLGASVCCFCVWCWFCWFWFWFCWFGFVGFVCFSVFQFAFKQICTKPSRQARPRDSPGLGEELDFLKPSATGSLDPAEAGSFLTSGATGKSTLKIVVFKALFEVFGEEVGELHRQIKTCRGPTLARPADLCAFLFH